METAKNVLERLEAMQNRGMSGLAILDELQQLIALAPAAVQEIYQAEMDMEQVLGFTAIEKGDAA